jgi:uncharacterized protein YycO
MVKQPKPGDFGLTKIGGILGFFVSLGQHLAGDSSKYTHAFIVLDNEYIIAAQPGGARLDKLIDYKNKAIYSNLDLTPQQRSAIVDHARGCEGIPYSYLDYLAIALARFGIKPKWLKKFIANKGHMICSQMVDEAYRKAGIHLFKDDRLPQEVTPGDLLYVLVREQDWIE